MPADNAELNGIAFGGVAQALVRQGIPAVIAMQFEISDPAALVFSQSFYQAIADGLSVDVAMVEARRAMFAEGHEVEWATPVLYMRSPDGRVFTKGWVSQAERQAREEAERQAREEAERQAREEAERQAREEGWAGFQQSLLGHLQARLGPGGRYWDVSGGKEPVVGVSERPPTEHRPYTVLSTVGMSYQWMPTVEQVIEDPRGFARIELAIATTMSSPSVARIFLWLAQYPWRADSWFGDGHTIRWYQEPAAFPLGGGNEAVLLLDDPGQLIGPEVPDLSGFSFASEPVRWLWILPITEQERQLAKERGSANLVAQLATQHRSWVIR